MLTLEQAKNTVARDIKSPVTAAAKYYKAHDYTRGAAFPLCEYVAVKYVARVFMAWPTNNRIQDYCYLVEHAVAMTDAIVQEIF